MKMKEYDKRKSHINSKIRMIYIIIIFIIIINAKGWAI